MVLVGISLVGVYRCGVISSVTSVVFFLLFASVAGLGVSFESSLACWSLLGTVWVGYPGELSTFIVGGVVLVDSLTFGGIFSVGSSGFVLLVAGVLVWLRLGLSGSDNSTWGGYY
jgi:hypothetical protein